MNDLEIYDKWVQDIAESVTEDELIQHFREHSWDHYNRYDRSVEGSLDTWLIGVLNFAHIFMKKYPHLTTRDLLFELSRYYQTNSKGTKPPSNFDADRFVEEYEGIIKEVEFRPKRN